MKRTLRWLGIATGGTAILCIGTVAIVWYLSEQIVGEMYDAPAETVVVPTDSASIAHGWRLARVLGCYDGCHGEGVAGRVFFDEPYVARLVAPDLSRAAAAYSDDELVRLLRYGITREGRSAWAMPSAMFYHLTDEDLGAVIAFLRSLPPGEGPDVEVRVGPIGRVGLVMGELIPQAKEVDRSVERKGRNSDTDPHALGRYVAMTACTECHGQNLRGRPGEMATPSLAIAAAYGEDEFAHLMRTGEALGGRELDLMALVAQTRFAHLTEEEILALHAFLSTLGRGDFSAESAAE